MGDHFFFLDLNIEGKKELCFLVKNVFNNYKKLYILKITNIIERSCYTYSVKYVFFF